MKQLVEHVLARLASRRARRGGQKLILAYHNVVPDGTPRCGDQALHIQATQFIEQLDAIESTCAVGSLASLIKDPDQCSRPRVALTFDDAYAGAITIAMPELSRRGLSGTIFVNPSLLGSPAFWWDEIANQRGALPKKLRDRALWELQGRGDHIRRAPDFVATDAQLPPWMQCATLDQLTEVAHLPGVTIASHSWGHPNLAGIPSSHLRDELSRPLAWLGDRFASAEPFLAYPYGLHAPHVVSAAKAAGYRAAFTCSGGWFRDPITDFMAIPRYNVPSGLSREGFLLRLYGIGSR